MKHEFKKGDIVTIGEHGTKQWKLITKHGAKLWHCQSLSSGKYNLHRVESFKIVKPEAKQDRSELYRLLPPTSEWGNGYNWLAVDDDGLVFSYSSKPTFDEEAWYMDWHYYINHITLPPSINWKYTLVSREEMEAWEKSQDVIEKLKDNFNQAIDEHLSQTETPQQKVDRCRLALEEAEKELEKSMPIDLRGFKNNPIDPTLPLFIGNGINPKGMEMKCLMLQDGFRLEQSQYIHPDNDKYTVLTFFKL